ncbi:MAG: hypothetical protein QXN71_02210 [Candidatus Aenigmatarchaeota archaeon]
MSEVTIMDMLLAVLSLLFLGIALAMRRLRAKMEADLKKNITPYMGLKYMYRHGVHESNKKSKK